MLVEVAAAHERDAYGLEIIGRRDADIRLLLLGAARPIETASAISARKRKPADSGNAFYARGLAHQSQGARDAAIADFSEAIRLDPSYANAFYARGLVYQAKGDVDRAIGDFNEAIRLGKKD